MSLRGTIARNTVYNAAGRAVEALAGLFITWCIVHQLGVDALGIWSLVAVFTGYAALLDFGLSSGFAKYVAEYAARDERDALSSVISAGILFYLLFGIVLLALGWPAIDWMMRHVVMPRLVESGDAPAIVQQRISEIRWLLWGALLLFAANNCIAPLCAVPTGLQRMGWTNLLSVGATVLKAVFMAVFLFLGGGLLGILYANAVALVFFAVGSAVVVWRLVPGFHLRLFYPDAAVFRQLFSFGWRTQVAKFSNLINFQTDRVVIAFVMGSMARVGLYRLGEELASKFRQVPGLLVSALLPAASDLDARNEQERLQALYLRSTKYMAAVSVPMTLFILATAPMLLHAWMGGQRDLTQAGWVLRILAVGYLANLLPGPGVSVALGKGRADIQMYAGLISTFSNIVLTLLLVFTVGFYGIPVATALGMLLSTCWFFWVMRDVMGVGPGKVLWHALWWPTMAALPATVFSWGIQLFFADQTGHALNLLLLLFLMPVFGISYLFLIGGTPFLDSFDARFLSETLRLQRIPGYRVLTRRARHVA